MTAIDLFVALITVVVASSVGWLTGRLITLYTPLGSWLVEQSMKRILQRETHRRRQAASSDDSA